MKTERVNLTMRVSVKHVMRFLIPSVFDLFYSKNNTPNLHSESQVKSIGYFPKMICFVVYSYYSASQNAFFNFGLLVVFLKEVSPFFSPPKT
jgi:hypothetical protein